MKRAATKSNEGRSHAARFLPVFDSSKQKRKVRGLVTRNGKFYAQMRVMEKGKSRAVRIPLESTRLDDAKAEAEKKRVEKREGDLHLPGKRPTFESLVKEYTESNIGTPRSRGKGFLSKSDSAQRHEKQSLERWKKLIGTKRIDWIDETELMAFVNQRTVEGVTNRTINLDLIAFNNAMTYAKLRKYITTPPRLGKQEEVEPEEKRLLTRDEVDRLIQQAQIPATFGKGDKKKTYHAKNGAQLALYLRLLAFSGCREQEALRIKKDDVNLKDKKLTIRGINTKSGKTRRIPANEELVAVLEELLQSLPEDTEWLFPSPIRGEEDRHADTLRQSFNLMREAAGMPWVGFHHLRHFFITRAVKSKIDYHRIAEWVGHNDGGVLIGKVYGHHDVENDLHAAKQLKF